MLASMDKPKLSSTASSKKSKLKHKTNSYMNELDMPPSSDDDVIETDLGDADEIPKARTRSAVTELSAATLSDKELKKREKKEQIGAANADHARKEALREDIDVFNVVIGTRPSALDPGGDDAAADAIDVVIGKRYGLVGGPNGKGKSTLLKLLAWRRIPVPRNIDVLLVVEQEVVGDDRTALDAVVSANEELVSLRKEVAAL